MADRDYDYDRNDWYDRNRWRGGWRRDYRNAPDYDDYYGADRSYRGRYGYARAGDYDYYDYDRNRFGRNYNMDRDYDYWGRGRYGYPRDYDYDYGYWGRGNRYGYGAAPTGNYEYGREYDRSWDTGPNWSYSETWYIPGPYEGQGPQGYQRSDERIREDANERLTRHGGLDASNIQVKVDNGEITLDGTVDSRHDKRMAEDAVEGVPGVIDVHNHLQINRNQSKNKS